MTDRFHKYTADELVEHILRKRGDDRTFAYAAGQSLLRRWSQGTDLEHLVGLLQSEKTRERLAGAYYLGELSAIDELKAPAMQLAADSLPDCRRAFVTYMQNSGFYDTAISGALAQCLLDLNLYVRVAVVEWAIETSDERFEEFAHLVESGIGRPEPKFSNPLSNEFWNGSLRMRATRGLEIIRRIRRGDEIQQIRRDVTEEDSFVFDIFAFRDTRRDRLERWKNMKPGR